MIVIPFYDLLALPEVTCYFQAEQLEKLSGKKINMDDDVIFLMMREQKEPDELEAGDFYPIGIAGHVEEAEHDGWVLLATTSRVNVSDVEVNEDGEISVEAVLRPDVEDIPEECVIIELD